MYKSKFINILKTLSVREIRLFQEYLRSPFFNKNGDLVDLFIIIKKEHPTYEGPIIERQQLYKTHYKNDFNEPKLRHAFSDLTKLMKNFLAYQQFQEMPYTKNQMLLKAFRQRDLENQFNSAFKQINKEREKSQIRDLYYLNSEYELNRIALLNTMMNKSEKKDPPTQKMLTALDTFFIGAKLKYTCEIYSSQFERNRELENLLLEEILIHLKSYPYEDTPTIQVYLSIFNMITNLDDESYFLELTEKLDHYGQYFSQRELNEMYIYARNYCAIKINLGDNDYFRKLFELYQDLIEKQLVYIDGSLSDSDYRNVVYVGLELGEHEYVKNFIYEQKDKLHPRMKQNIFDYNLAYYFFTQKNYDQTLKLLNRVEIENSFDYLDMHGLLLSTYYELDEVAPLLAHIDRLKTYLQRNKKVSASVKASYMNFVKLVKKMASLKSSGTKKTTKLKEEIDDNTQPIANRSWVRSKIKELEE